MRRDDEQRGLAEIEWWLGDDDPRLAHRLAALQPPAIWSVRVTAVAMTAAVISSLLVLGVGARLHSAALIALGAALSVVVPTLILVWRFWSRHGRCPDYRGPP
jgi:hypothetical protein